MIPFGVIFFAVAYIIYKHQVGYWLFRPVSRVLHMPGSSSDV